MRLLIAMGIALLASATAATGYAGPGASVSRQLHQAHRLLDAGRLAQASAAAGQAHADLNRLAYTQRPGQAVSGTVLASLFGQTGHVYRRLAGLLPEEDRGPPCELTARHFTTHTQLLEELEGRQSKAALESRLELAAVLLECGRARHAWKTLAGLFDKEGRPPAALEFASVVEALRLRSRAEWESGWKRTARKSLEVAERMIIEEEGRGSALRAALKSEPAHPDHRPKRRR